jgi:ubiquinone/menaquinone biosynthesis C-methylase UbiE
MYELYPNAHYVLIDIANDMLKIAEKRFMGLSNFEFLVSDYAEDIPVKNCDLICSALSIHHLENNEKAALYKNCYKKLDKRGCFLNLDQFNAETETMNHLYNDWWYNRINSSVITKKEQATWMERRKLDKENTIPETIELLKDSGFRAVECIYSFMKFGVILAIK